MDERELATFAGGCFWCMVKPFDELPGIVSVVSGYTGGHTSDPTYEEVGRETTGHFEAVQIAFEPAIFPYSRLLDLYWQLIDPTDDGGQFYDRGGSYRTAIFYHTDEQRRQAEASKQALKASGRFKKPIVTAIRPAAPFYPAEEEHQRYYRKNPYEYKLYMEGSGREAFAERMWRTKADAAELRRRLTPLQFDVTQNRTFEPAYDNPYWNERRAGIYVDAVSGDPLFGSPDQFDSGTGWPSFRKPLDEGCIRREAELRGGRARTAVVGRLSRSFLGYWESGGTAPDGHYYRVNSAALRFVPFESLEAAGFGRFRALFDQ